MYSLFFSFADSLLRGYKAALNCIDSLTVGRKLCQALLIICIDVRLTSKQATEEQPVTPSEAIRSA